jgi:hypothetical protein
METLTCSEWQRVVALQQFSFLVQEPFGPEFLGVAPEFGVIMETPQIHEHHRVLHQVTPN